MQGGQDETPRTTWTSPHFPRRTAGSVAGPGKVGVPGSCLPGLPSGALWRVRATTWGSHDEEGWEEGGHGEEPDGLCQDSLGPVAPDPGFLALTSPRLLNAAPAPHQKCSAASRGLLVAGSLSQHAGPLTASNSADSSPLWGCFPGFPPGSAIACLGDTSSGI